MYYNRIGQVSIMAPLYEKERLEQLEEELEVYGPADRSAGDSSYFADSEGDSDEDSEMDVSLGLQVATPNWEENGSNRYNLQFQVQPRPPVLNLPMVQIHALDSSVFQANPGEFTSSDEQMKSVTDGNFLMEHNYHAAPPVQSSSAHPPEPTISFSSLIDSDDPTTSNSEEDPQKPSPRFMTVSEFIEDLKKDSAKKQGRREPHPDDISVSEFIRQMTGDVGWRVRWNTQKSLRFE